MALKKFMEKLRTPIEELDRADREAYFASVDCTPIDALEPQQDVKVAGEVSTVRIVPRAGAPAVEVAITDGRGTVTGVFLGRRKIAGMTPGKRVRFEGFAGKHRGQLMIYNPVYRFLAR